MPGTARRPVNHRPDWRRRRILTGIVALVVAGTGIAAGGQATGWWGGGELAERTAQVIEETFDDTVITEVSPEAAGKIGEFNTAHAREVASTSKLKLVAVPRPNESYCLAPATDSEPYLGMVCTDGSSGLPAAQESIVATWATGTPGDQAWHLLGRIVSPDARSIALFDMNLSLEKNGFFVAEIPADRWAALDQAEGKLTIYDDDGRLLSERCVALGPSPCRCPTTRVSRRAAIS